MVRVMRVSRELSKRLVIAVMLTPAVVVALIFLAVPAVLTVLISLTELDYRFKWIWCGLDKYALLLRDPVTRLVVNATVIYVTGTLAFNTLWGLCLALLSTHVHDALGTFMRAAWLLPRVLPSVVWAMLMMWIFSPLDTGFLNSVIISMGGQPVPWTFQYYWPFLFIVNGCIGSSLAAIIFSSAIKSIPPDYIIAAKVDGASGLTHSHPDHTAYDQVAHRLLRRLQHPVPPRILRVHPAHPQRGTRLLHNRGSDPQGVPPRLRAVHDRHGLRLRRSPRHDPPRDRACPLDCVLEGLQAPQAHDRAQARVRWWAW
uniref:Sugar ABC transporter permease n=1 Tax=Thermofilum pendens TaxID=2269 RepID=A0A7C3SPK4_THEPE